MKKIKQFLTSERGKDILVVIIVILVGLGSFELGRLSKINDSSDSKALPAQAGGYQENQGNGDDNTTGPTDTTQTSIKSIDVKLASSGKNFFASSRGKKYYTISCSAGKTIKAENKVWFVTEKEAETAGYTLSSSCK